jgi:mannose/cellobiose epimerase-like protein (N-acyl-D-glucosamine 2-epimerase family)
MDRSDRWACRGAVKVADTRGRGGSEVIAVDRAPPKLDFVKLIRLVWLTAVLTCLRGLAEAADREAELRNAAVQWKRTLTDRLLPYWYDHALDWTNGGYILCDDASKGPCEPDEKQLVTQARMVWGFSAAHRLGLSTVQRNYLRAASNGVAFLTDRMRDADHGGYFFSVSPDGTPRNTRKILYGEAFVIYGLAEYYRASGDVSAREEALGLYRLIQKRAHDSANGGWLEHFERDWTPVPAGDGNAIVEVAGGKSANSHLHWMEALAELYDVTHDPAVRRSLQEALRLNKRHFYPLDAAESAFHFTPDWRRMTGPGHDGLSYGHNVEFAWLMIRAEEVLGRAPSWGHFEHHIRHALRCGFDAEHGGGYNRGTGDDPATDTSKVWWVQAEFIAALSDAASHHPHRRDYNDALLKTLGFVEQHMADPKDGIWVDTVTADGQPKDTRKAHAWKANYHDLRSLVKFIDAFGGAK